MILQSPTVEASELAKISTWVRWRTVVALLLLYALALVDRQVLSLLVDPIRADLGVSDFQIGLLQGLSFALLFSLCGLPFGYAVDRYSRRLVILFGVLIWALATTTSAFAENYASLFIARMLVGVGEAALAPAAYSILSDMFPRERLTFAMSIYALGSILGGAGALALTGFVAQLAVNGLPGFLGQFEAWQAVFFIVGVPGIGLAFLALTFPEPRRRHINKSQAAWGDLFSFIHAHKRFFICHLGGFTCIMTIAYGILGWQAVFLMRTFGWSMAQTGALLAVTYLATGTLCFLFSGRMVDYLWQRGYRDAHLRFYVVASLFSAVLGSLSFQMHDPLWYFVLMGFASISTKLAAIAPAALQVVTPNELRGRVSAIYLMVTGIIGMTLGPALVAGITDFLFADDSKIHMSLTITYALLAPLAAIFFWFGMRPMREMAMSIDTAR